jgi:hypothetical protein
VSRFVEEHRDRFGVEAVCRVLEVPERLHEGLGDIPPAEHERNHDKDANNRRRAGRPRK